MTHGNVKKSPEKQGSTVLPRSRGQPVRTGKRAATSCVDSPAEKRRALRSDIERILDELDESALSNALDAIRLCRYGMELELHKDKVLLQKQGADPGCGEMRIERSVDGSTYHLIAGDSWKILAAEEIASLLRIARHTENETLATRRLWQWFRQERRDIALDLGIEKADSERLGIILHLLKETFPVKSPRRLP